MKLSQIAAKPQLVMFTINDEEIVKEYGEPIEFYSWDRQPLDVFMKLANASQQNTGMLVEILKDLILDEEGKAILVDDIMLPNHVLLKVVGQLVEKLGK